MHVPPGCEPSPQPVGPACAAGSFRGSDPVRSQPAPPPTKGWLGWAARPTPHWAWRRPLAALVVGGALVGLLAVVPGTRGVRADDGPASSAPLGFARFERAWRGRDASAVVHCMAERGRLRVRLFERPFRREETYTMLADRAGTSLDQYFEHIERLQLTERRPDDERERGSSLDTETVPTVRTYDYTYRVKGKSAATSRLQVRVTQTEGDGWVLESVIELPGRDGQDPDRR
ncbi:MAG: hypothetical protein AB7T63_08325 [Planctomycetota bacterium]